MEHKVLIADDSLTIQKVIKITLSNEPFAMSECADAGKLKQDVENLMPSIVLLDFNLSENKTGYDLARDIKEVSPKTQILMLFGAFDSIDEGLLQDSGCAYHIIKPFDGTKFINLCRTMAQDFDTNSDSQENNTDSDFDFSTDEELGDIPAPIDETPSDDADDWVVNQPDIIEDDLEDEMQDIPEPISAKTTELDQSIEDWGMEVPSIINRDDDGMGDIPGVIEESTPADIPEPIETKEQEPSTPVTPSATGDEIVLPDNDDLEYPDMMSPSSNDQHEDEVKTPQNDDLEYPDLDSMDSLDVETEADRKAPSLVPASELNQVTEETIEVSQGGTDSEEALKSLEDDISDELAEEDLWAADEFEESTQEEDNNFVDREMAPTEEKTDDFKSMDLDDLPQIEPHNLEKVIDNTYDDEDEQVSVQSEDSPDDFPSDVMEESHDNDYDEDQSSNLDDIASFDSSVDESMNKIDEAVKIPEQLISADFEEKLQKELTDKLTPIVEEYVKEYCKNSIEKIAWEIIPDLAENVIKKEIQKISDSIMDN